MCFVRFISKYFIFGTCISQFFIAVTKIAEQSNLREEGFILAQGFSPSWLGGHGRAAPFRVARNERERESPC
jgi:hypothetical protein